LNDDQSNLFYQRKNDITHTIPCSKYTAMRERPLSMNFKARGKGSKSLLSSMLAIGGGGRFEPNVQGSAQILAFVFSTGWVYFTFGMVE
jgi:hypothetical protein